MRKLTRVGLDVVELSYLPQSSSMEGMPSAVGNYINFFRV
jgi:hypothetical protein